MPTNGPVAQNEKLPTLTIHSPVMNSLTSQHTSPPPAPRAAKSTKVEVAAMVNEKNQADAKQTTNSVEVVFTSEMSDLSVPTKDSASIDPESSPRLKFQILQAGGAGNSSGAEASHADDVIPVSPKLSTGAKFRAFFKNLACCGGNQAEYAPLTQAEPVTPTLSKN